MKNQERANALRRQHRQEWLAAGICTVCRKKEALPGRHRCAECARISSERNKRAYKARQTQAKESYYRRKEQGACASAAGPQRSKGGRCARTAWTKASAGGWRSRSGKLRRSVDG